MKKLYFVYSEGDCGEIQGVFDEKENLIDFWSCNDATWRNEYFETFMEAIGFETVENIPQTEQFDRLERALIKQCKKEWGC